MRTQTFHIPARTELGPDPEPIGVRFEAIMAEMERAPDAEATAGARAASALIATFAPALNGNGIAA